MGGNPSSFKKGNDYPVENVSWNDVQKFIRKLSALNNNKYQFRLPTEAEWEYACRAGSTERFYFGNNQASLGKYAWYWNNSKKHSHEVGAKLPNAWGLYDVLGNVWEWCQDWFNDQQITRSLRGASWNNDEPDIIAITNRSDAYPMRYNPMIGFRVVVAPVE